MSLETKLPTGADLRAEIDRLRYEQRERDKESHLPGQAARPQLHRRVTSVESI